MNNISWDEFKKIEIRIGTIIEVNDFPEAIKPAYQVKIDLGEKIGCKQSSAQITELYSKNELLDKQVLVVVNLSPKKIGPFISDCLITGFEIDNEGVVLSTSDKSVPNGTLLT